MPCLNRVRLNPYNRVVSRHQQLRLTYDSLDRKSNALARGLINIGVRKGDRVAVSLGNNIEYAIVCDLELVRRRRANRPRGDLWPFQAWGYLGELIVPHFLVAFYWSREHLHFWGLVPSVLMSYICFLLSLYTLNAKFLIAISILMLAVHD